MRQIALILSILLITLCDASQKSQRTYHLSYRSFPDSGAEVTLTEKFGRHRDSFHLGRIGHPDWFHRDWVLVRGQTMVGGLFNALALNAYDDELMLVIYDLKVRQHAFYNPEPYYFVVKDRIHIFEDGRVFGIVRHYGKRDPEWLYFDRKSGVIIKPVPEKYRSAQIEFRGLDGRPRFRIGKDLYLLRKVSFLKSNEWVLGLEEMRKR
jgi:hypothetical protein